MTLVLNKEACVYFILLVPNSKPIFLPTLKTSLIKVFVWPPVATFTMISASFKGPRVRVPSVGSFCDKRQTKTLFLQLVLLSDIQLLSFLVELDHLCFVHFNSKVGDDLRLLTLLKQRNCNIIVLYQHQKSV